MIPAETPTTNVTLAGDGDRVADMPAERIRVFDPDDVEQTGESSPAIETTWLVDEGEVRALANGAPILVRLWGERHPPINLTVGDPPEEAELVPLVNLDHARRAANWLLAELAARLLDGSLPEPVEVAGLFDRALAETKDAHALEKIEAVRERARIAAEDRAGEEPSS